MSIVEEGSPKQVRMAKLHIELINDVASAINSDPEVQGLLAWPSSPTMGSP